jgi:uncharacterized protein (TIGR02265 family)
MQQPASRPPDQVVYHAALESLTRAVQADQQPALIEEMRTRCGYDLRRPQREYPPDVARKVLDLLTERCFPDLPRVEAYEEFGRRAFAAYRATVVGRVIMAALHMATAFRALQLAAQAFKSVSNYTRFEAIADGPRAAVFRAHHSILHPRYMLGLLDGLLAACGHRDATITVDAVHAPDLVDYHVSW